MSCPHCHSSRIVKNGHTPKGRQNYLCRLCGRQFLLNARPCSYPDTIREQVLAALNERMSLHGVQRIFRIARQTIAKWLRQKADQVTQLPLLPGTIEDEELLLEGDEVWSFIGRKQQQAWLWVLLDRATRRVVAWASGDRSIATAQQLWQKVPIEYQTRCHCFTDFWSVYANVFSADQHTACGKESGETSHIERWNNTLRQRVGRFVRKTLSFSKSEKMHLAAITWFIYCYNLDH